MNPTLPGSIPGLLRRGAPVFLRDEETPYVVTAPPFHDADDALWVIAAPCAGIPLGVQDDPSNFALDLSDATGRAHAAWWLATTLYNADGPYLVAAVLPGRVLGPLAFGLSTISVGDGERWRRHPAFEVCADLDPLDPRILPDGSRWVDAEALRRVVLRVAGVSA